MKVLYIFLLCVFSGFLSQLKAQTYPSLNISLLAHIDPEKDPTGYDNRKYSGCWGWYQQSKNKEYAIVGTSAKTYFIDVTNPSSPIIRDSVMARRTGCTWREIKNYQNYCYIVSDDGAPNSFQIVDMQYLPDSVHIVHDGTTYFERCHTIFVDNDKLYCGLPTKPSSATQNMQVYSLTNPEAPQLLRTLSDDVAGLGTVHDMYVRNDTVYASCGNEGFRIIKFNSATNTFSLMQSFTGYPYSGYNHSSWQTDDRKTMVFADEVPGGLPAKVIDVSDFSNITLVDTIRSNFAATAHNPYIMGNKWCWISTYLDGLYLYDISTPSNTTVYGYFDTYPQGGVNNNFAGTPYRGNWGAYPYLPSKIIIACDMQNGIFILDGDNTYKTGFTSVKEQSITGSVFSVYPNPAQNELLVLVASQNNKDVAIEITDVLGKMIQTVTAETNGLLSKNTINTSGYAAGCYYVTVKGNNLLETKKIIIQK